jgi:eukaryotic-like serine/threonine-protein kinase
MEKMMTAAINCPADDDLAAHLSGQLDAIQVDRIRIHLDGCESCRLLTIALVRANGTPGPARQLSSLVRTPQQLDINRIGRYQIQHVIGTGGMGIVYAAHDPSLHRSVALKVLRPALAQLHPTLTERLMKESQLLARVSDPAVITVFDAGMVDDQFFLAMELIDGETLGDWARQRREQPADIEAIIDIFLRAGAGLLAAHRAGVLHRDFKPDNVLLAPADARLPTRVIVTDFGLARNHAVDNQTLAIANTLGNVDVSKTALTANS